MKANNQGHKRVTAFIPIGQEGMERYEKAAEYLTPVSLEPGAKNPCVVAADTRLDYAAMRIAWWKLIN